MKRFVLVAVLLGACTPVLAQGPLPKFQDTAQVKGASPALKTVSSGIWWRDSEWVNALGLTAEQQRKMDDIFQQYRLKLVDLNANLQKEEMILEPMIENVRPGDEPRVLAQIDRIAEARAELEKANARMLLAIRQSLTPDQWVRVSATNSKEKAKVPATEPAVKSKSKEDTEPKVLKKSF